MQRWVVLLCLTSGACTVKFPSVQGLNIQCANNDECPSGSTCSSQLERCVPVGQEDVPPTFQNVSVSGVILGMPVADLEVAGVGTVVRLSFDVSEALVEDPTVTIELAGQTRSVRATSGDGGHYQLEYIVGEEDNAGAVSLLLRAIDVNYNVGTLNLPNQLTIDKEPPALGLALPLAYLAPADALITDVDAAAEGTAIVTAFALNERLAAPPSVVLTSPDGSVTLEPTQLLDQNPFYDVRFVIPGGIGTSELGDDFEVRVSATDRAGNPTPQPLLVATALVDTNPPEAPSDLRLMRVPWGADTTGGAPVMRVERSDGQPVVASDGRGLVVLEGDQAVYDDVIEEVSNGVASIPLSGGQRPLVWVSAVDDAGNASPTQRVKSARLVASLRGKTAGNSAINPHNVAFVDEPGNALFDPEARSPNNEQLANLAAGDSVAWIDVVETGAWRRRTQLHPGRTLLGAMTTVGSSGATVLVGGQQGEGSLTNVWRWSEEDWRELDFTGALSPGSLLLPGLTYDSLRDAVVLHGGTVSVFEVFDTTWELDGLTWLNATPSSQRPRAVGQPLVFDNLSGQTLLFGGADVYDGECPDGSTPTLPLCPKAELWAWNGSAWSQLHDGVSGAPPSRVGNGAAFDAEREALVIFGGISPAASTPLDDLWEWREGAWTQASQAPSWPAPRINAVVAYLEEAGGTLIWGGCGGTDFVNCADLGEPDTRVWVWSGTDMAAYDVSGAVPTNRGSAPFAAQPSEGAILMTGGARVVATNQPDCTAFATVCDGGPAVSQGGGANVTCRCDFDATWRLRVEPSVDLSPPELAWQVVSRAGQVPDADAEFGFGYADGRAWLMGGRDRTFDTCDFDGGGNCPWLTAWDGRGWQTHYQASETECGDLTATGLGLGPCPETGKPLVSLPEGDVAYLSWRTVGAAPSTHSGLWRVVASASGSDSRWAPPVANGSNADYPPFLEGVAAGAVTGPAGTEVLLFGGVVREEGGVVETCADLDVRYPGSQDFGFDSSDPSFGCISRALWRLRPDVDGVWEIILPVNPNDGPTPRYEAAAVSMGSLLLLYGGCADGEGGDCDQSLSDTWLFDSTDDTWTQIAMLTPNPGPRNNAKMAFASLSSADTGVVYLFGGGSNGLPGNNDLWALDLQEGVPASQWRLLSIEGVRPTSRRRHALVYDTQRERLVMAGDGSHGDLWEMRLAGDNRPVLVATFSWGAGAVGPALDAEGLATPAGGAADARQSITRVELRAVASGAGYQNSTPVAGIVVQAWNARLARWAFFLPQDLPVEAGATEPDAQCAVSGDEVRCELAGPGAADYVLPGTESVYFRMAPLGGAGSLAAGATLSVDVVELTVDYTLP